MNFTQLKYFIAVYEERNITSAAKRCYISQPSISNSIRELEEELNTKLFSRHKKGVDLTEEAHYLYPLAIQILNDINKLPDLFNKGKEIQHLTVSVFPNLSPAKTAKVISTLNEKISHLKLNIVNPDTDADCKLTLDILKKDDEIFLPLWEEDYYLCTSKNHEAAKYNKITINELHKYGFIECPSCEAHQQTIGLLACEGLHMNIVATTENKYQVMCMVKSGIGISFLPEGVIEMDPELIKIDFRGPRMFRRIGLCYPANKSLIPVLSKTVKILSEIDFAL